MSKGAKVEYWGDVEGYCAVPYGKLTLKEGQHSRANASLPTHLNESLLDNSLSTNKKIL